MSTVSSQQSKFDPRAKARPKPSPRPPVVKEKPAQKESNSSSDELNLHSCYYRDFFLLRTAITINGRPAVIKVANGDPVLRVSGVSVKLSAILQQAVSPVLIKHGVYQVETFYYEQVPLFSLKFQSRLSLKQFLTDKEAVHEELTSAIASISKMESKLSEKQSLRISLKTKIYLFSPIAGRSPHVVQVNCANHSFMFETWKRSKLFDFTTGMYTMKLLDTTAGVPEKAKLADLQNELKPVVEWFSLGVQLEIPETDLLTIEEDYRKIERCRIQMLIRWGELEKPTWSKLVRALVNIDRKVLANKLAKKYGVPSPNAKVKVNNEESTGYGDHKDMWKSSEEKLLSLEEEVEKATQSRDAVSKALEMDIENSVPELQMKISSLNNDVSRLKLKLRRKEEENQMLDEMNQNLKTEWSDVFARTRKDNSEAIKVLKEELKKKEDEFALTKTALAKKEKELREKSKELDKKSDLVIQLQTQLQQKRVFQH